MSPGDTVGEWTLVEYAPLRRPNGGVRSMWLCRCSCGVERSVRTDHLNARRTQSCGHDMPERVSVAQTRRWREIKIGASHV